MLKLVKDIIMLTIICCLARLTSPTCSSISRAQSTRLWLLHRRRGRLRSTMAFNNTVINLILAFVIFLVVKQVNKLQGPQSPLPNSTTKQVSLPLHGNPLGSNALPQLHSPSYRARGETKGCYGATGRSDGVRLIGACGAATTTTL